MPTTDDGLDVLLHAVAAAPPLPLGDLAGERFRLIRRLGEGTFGVVFEAEDRLDQKRVALKMLRDPRAEWLHRFKREFRALQDLRHVNLVALEELFCVGERWFFTMELLEGIDIVDYARSGLTEPHGFDEARLRDALRQLMEGLACFHATGRVHRDIKPSNVRVTREGRVVVLDFGLATEPTQDDEAASAIVGTPAYMAPEQAAGRAVTPAADQYAVGVLLYEMLTGDRPAGARLMPGSSTQLDARRAAAAGSQAPRALPSSVPPDLAELCASLLHRDPSGRPEASRVAASLLGGPVPAVRGSREVPIPQQLLVGREPEIAALTAALAQVERGELVSLVVCGESGIGKTSVVRRFLDDYRVADDYVVLAGRCYEKESVPFKAFDEIVDALSNYLLKLPRLEVAGLVPRHAAYLRVLFPVIGRVMGFDRALRTPHEISDAHELRHRAFYALRDIFVGLCERQTVIVHIDDFQWADQDSLLLLSSLLAEPDPPRMLLLATSRQAVDLGALGIAGVTRTIELGPLSRPNAALLAHQLFGAPAPAFDASQFDLIIDEARGHPYFIIELVRHIHRAAAEPGIRLELDEAIWTRASHEDPAALRILKYVCVAGVPIEPHALQQVVGDPPASFRARCAALTRECLIRTTDGLLVPYHDRVREAVVKRLAVDELQQLHAGLAIAFADHTDLALLVRHLEASGQPEKAAEMAVAAARRARDGLALEQAVALYRHSLRLGASGATRYELLCECGATLGAMGKGLEAAQVYAEAALEADPERRLTCNIQAAHQLLISGHLQQGILKIRELFAEQGMAYPSTPTYALLRIAGHRLAMVFRKLDRLTARRREPTSHDRARIALYKAVIQGLVLVDPIRAAFCVGGALRLTRRIADHEDYKYFLLLEGDLRMAETSRPDAGARVVEAFDAFDAVELSPTIVAVHKGARTYMNMRGGDAEALEALLGADDQLATTRIAPWELVGGRTFILLLLRRLGRYSELKQRFTAYMLDARARNDVYTEATMRGFGNLLHLIDHDPRRARHELSASMWLSLEYGFHVQHWYDFNAVMEMHIYEGTAPDAEHIARQLDAFRSSRLGRLAVFAAETEWLVGRLALAFPDLSLFGRRRVRTAIRRLERTTAGYPRLLAAELRAGLARVAGNPDEAAAQLRSAISLAKGLDMRVASAAAGYQLGRLIAGSDGDAMCARSRDTLTAEGVRDVDRFVNLVIPGFPP